MNILIDTHYLLWSFMDTSQIRPQILAMLLSEENEIFYSQASLWEISIKYKHGKLVMHDSSPEQLYDEVSESQFKCREFRNTELISFQKLPIEHRDPFDRIMIWQAINSEYHFLSWDAEIHKYEKYGLKVLS